MSSPTANFPLTGGCQCGAVQYELGEPPLQLYICHCAECRKQSASAFGMSVSVRRGAFHLLSGSLKTWSRPTDAGNRLDCHFCTECGSRIWHENGPDTPNITIKAGSLDDPPDMAEGIHIWTARALKGVNIPADAICKSGEPDD
jgi:hypothetical protein